VWQKNSKPLEKLRRQNAKAKIGNRRCSTETKTSQNYLHVSGAKAQTKIKHITINDDTSDFGKGVCMAIIRTEQIRSKNKITQQHNKKYKQ